MGSRDHGCLACSLRRDISNAYDSGSKYSPRNLNPSVEVREGIADAYDGRRLNEVQNISCLMRRHRAMVLEMVKNRTTCNKPRSEVAVG